MDGQTVEQRLASLEAEVNRLRGVIAAAGALMASVPPTQPPERPGTPR